MNFYERHVVPRLLALAMRNRVLLPYRQRIGAQAMGRVLEIGIGSGLNLPFYGASVRDVVGVEPSPMLIGLARGRSADLPFGFRVLEGVGENLPLESGSVDTVLTSWSLCSVADPMAVLGEARRVLRPGGQLLFVEHGRSSDAGVRMWQDRLDPVWTRLVGGCHLNRPMDDLVSRAGFAMAELRMGYAGGPRPMTFMYEGRAVLG